MRLPPVNFALSNLERRELDHSVHLSPDQQWGAGDFIDMVNPLHYVPVVGGIYRALSGDELSPQARMVGATLYGGPIGAALVMADEVVAHHSGNRVENHVASLLTQPDDSHHHIVTAQAQPLDLRPSADSLAQTPPSVAPPGQPATELASPQPGTQTASLPEEFIPQSVNSETRRQDASNYTSSAPAGFLPLDARSLSIVQGRHHYGAGAAIPTTTPRSTDSSTVQTSQTPASSEPLFAMRAPAQNPLSSQNYNAGSLSPDPAPDPGQHAGPLSSSSSPSEVQISNRMDAALQNLAMQSQSLNSDHRTNMGAAAQPTEQISANGTSVENVANPPQTTQRGSPGTAPHFLAAQMVDPTQMPAALEQGLAQYEDLLRQRQQNEHY